MADRPPVRTTTHTASGRPLRRETPEPGLVSVVIPAFNAAAWLGETLASVNRQSYRPIEVIVCDDGSSDRTVDIARQAGARVIEANGSGPGGARNAGLAVARGELIQFLDADDLLAPEKIARQVGVLALSGADVAWEAFDHLVPASADHDAAFIVGRRVRPELRPDLPASLLTARGFIQLGAMLVRRSPVTDVVVFEPGREVVEDVRYTVALALAGARFVSSDVGEAGLLYRQHAGPRYSARPVASFARGCARNAQWAESQWATHGGLTPARREALGEAYAFAARQLAATDPAAFEDVMQRGLALGPSFLRHMPARVRWLARVVGYRRAEAIATRWRAGARRRAGIRPGAP